MARVGLLLIGAIVAVVAAAWLAFVLTTDRDPSNDPPWSQDTIEFVSWNGERWTAWIRDDSFELLPQNTADWHRHSNGSIAFVDSQGDLWQAKIDGDRFLLAHRGDWKGPTEQAEALRYRDWRGKEQLRTVAQLRRP